MEAVSGLDFMDYVDKYILDPIGLDDTFAPGGDFDVSRLAKTYRGDDTRALPADSLNAIGAGGIYATASDLAAFGGALTGTELQPVLPGRHGLPRVQPRDLARGHPGLLAYGLGWDNMEWYPFCQSDIQALVKGGDTLTTMLVWWFCRNTIWPPRWSAPAACPPIMRWSPTNF